MRKSILKPYKTITAGDMSGNVTGLTTNVEGLDNLLIELEWSGTGCNGSFDVEVRSQLRDNTYTSWKALSFGAPVLVASNSGNHILNLSSVPFTEIRVVYNFSAGVGSCDAVISGKVGGA